MAKAKKQTKKADAPRKVTARVQRTFKLGKKKQMIEFDVEIDLGDVYVGWSSDLKTAVQDQVADDFDQAMHDVTKVVNLTELVKAKKAWDKLNSNEID